MVIGGSLVIDPMIDRVIAFSVRRRWLVVAAGGLLALCEHRILSALIEASLGLGLHPSVVHCHTTLTHQAGHHGQTPGMPDLSAPLR